MTAPRCWICGGDDPSVPHRLSIGCGVIICERCETTIVQEHINPLSGWTEGKNGNHQVIGRHRPSIRTGC